MLANREDHDENLSLGSTLFENVLLWGNGSSGGVNWCIKIRHITSKQLSNYNLNSALEGLKAYLTTRMKIK